VTAATVTLCEWETLRPEPGNPLAERGLINDANRKLAEHLTTAGYIEVLELARSHPREERA
jgi:hypothetical protein